MNHWMWTVSLAGILCTAVVYGTDMLTEKDRLNIDFLYYSHVTGELDKAYSVLVRSLELFRRDVFFHAWMARRGANLPGAPIYFQQLNPAPITEFYVVMGNWSDGTPVNGVGNSASESHKH